MLEKQKNRFYKQSLQYTVLLSTSATHWELVFCMFQASIIHPAVWPLCLQAVYKCLLDRVPEEQKDTNIQWVFLPYSVLPHSQNQFFVHVLCQDGQFIFPRGHIRDRTVVLRQTSRLNLNVLKLKFYVFEKGKLQHQSFLNNVHFYVVNKEPPNLYKNVL